jgi:DNA-binding NarL/FixJ family response regulator
METTPVMSVDHLIRQIRAVTAVDVAFGGTLSAANGSLVIDRLSGARTGALRSLRIRTGLGLGGKAMLLRRPVAVRDYQQAGGITHEYDRAVAAEGLRAVFAIPVIIGAGVRAVVYGALRQDAPLGDRTLAAAAGSIAAAVREAEIATEVERRLATHQARRAELSEQAQETRCLAQRLREAQTELTAIAAQTSDPVLRARLDALSDTLRAPLGQARNVLSRREVDVLVQVADGQPNRAVGDRLNLEPNTVKAYLRSAMRKLGTTNRTATVSAARRLGIIA